MSSVAAEDRPPGGPASRGDNLARRVAACWWRPVGKDLSGPVALGANLAVVAGGALIVATAAIHLHLWLAGYRHVPKLDVLFMAQAVTGFLLGPLVAVVRRVAVALAGAVFMGSSAGGLILSATVGFVGIHDDLTVPWATPSLAVELAGLVLLGSSAVTAAFAAVRAPTTATDPQARHASGGGG